MYDLAHVAGCELCNLQCLGYVSWVVSVQTRMAPQNGRLRCRISICRLYKYVDDISVADLSADDLYVDDLSVDDLSVDDISADDPSVDDLSVDSLSDACTP